METDSFKLDPKISRDPDLLLNAKASGQFLGGLSEACIRRYWTTKKLRKFKVGGRSFAKVRDLVGLIEEAK